MKPGDAFTDAKHRDVFHGDDHVVRVYVDSDGYLAIELLRMDGHGGARTALDAGEVKRLQAIARRVRP